MSLRPGKVQDETPDNAPAVAGQSAISFDHVAISYDRGKLGTLEAVHDFHLDVPTGHVVSIVGPSGCGKTSILEATGGLRRISRGAIRVAGTEVKGVPAEVRIVFQEDSTLPWRTAQRNVEFALENQGMSRSARRSQAREMLALVGLNGFEESYPSELSGGMRQRVAIARGLATMPRVLLLDEPFGALDEQTRLELGCEVRRMRQATGTTIILVTHSVQEAVLLSDQVVVLSSRPTNLLGIVEIGSDIPRDASMLESPRFGGYVSDVWRLLHQASRPKRSPGEQTSGSHT